MYRDDPEMTSNFTTTKNNSSDIEQMELMRNHSTQNDQRYNELSIKDKCKRAAVPASCKEGILTICCVNTFILTIVLAVLLSSSTTITTPATCQTPECIQLASTLLSNMNRSADPCEDFYEYTCGNWAKTNPIPDDRSRYSTFTKLYEQNEEILRRILDNPSTSTTTSGSNIATTATEKAMYIYQSCMDVEAIEAKGSTPIKDLIDQVYWLPKNGLSQPLNTNDDVLKFTNTLGLLWKNDINPFIYASVGSDDKDSNNNIMFIGQSGLSLPDRSYYLSDGNTKKNIKSDQSLMALQQYIVDTIVLYEGSDITTAIVRAQEIVQFEQLLAIHMATKTTLRDPRQSYNKLNINTELNKQYILWNEFMKYICNDQCSK
jgi:putative endopeptidase